MLWILWFLLMGTNPAPEPAPQPITVTAQEPAVIPVPEPETVRPAPKAPEPPPGNSEKPRGDTAEVREATPEPREALASRSGHPKAEPSGAVYEVTAYTVGDSYTPSHGVTASGKKVQAGRTCACPPDLPFGTEIYIPELGQSFICEDRGGAITTRRLDIYMSTEREALDFGRRALQVQIKKSR